MLTNIAFVLIVALVTVVTVANLSYSQSFGSPLQLHSSLWHPAQISSNSRHTSQTQTNQLSFLDARYGAYEAYRMHNSAHHITYCPQGPPLHWRPHLDAASKAHLAPVIVVGRLDHLSIGTQSSVSSLMATDTRSSNVPLATASQPTVTSTGASVLWVNAVFSILKVRKNSIQMNDLEQPTSKLYSEQLATGKRVTFAYKVNASPITANLLMNINSNKPQQQITTTQLENLQYPQIGSTKIAQETQVCPLELSEREIEKRAASLFRLNNEYILFLAAAPSASQNLGGQILHPYTSHEPFTNQTNLTLQRVLCKSCARVPKVNMLGQTPVVTAYQAPNARVALECKIVGYPTPWVQWLRFGRPLKQRGSRLSISTRRLRGKLDVFVSRLEIQLQANKNDSGVYECRAQNVAAREPSLAQVILVELPAHLAPHPTILMPSPTQQPQQVSPLQTLSTTNQSQTSISRLTASLSVQQEQSPQTILSSGQTASANTSLNAEVEIPGPPKLSQSSNDEPNNKDHLANQNNIDKGQQRQQQSFIATTQQPTQPLSSSYSALIAPVLSNKSPSHQQQYHHNYNHNIHHHNSQQPTTLHPPKQQQQQQPSFRDRPCQAPFDKSYCANNGVCIEDVLIATYLCKCAEGFHGVRCQYKHSSALINHRSHVE